MALISEQPIPIYVPTYTYDDFQVTLESHRAVHRYVVYKSRISVEYAPSTTNVLRITSQYYMWCWHLIDILPIRMCVSYTDSIIYSWGQYVTNTYVHFLFEIIFSPYTIEWTARQFDHSLRPYSEIIVSDRNRHIGQWKECYKIQKYSGQKMYADFSLQGSVFFKRPQIST